MAGPQWAAFSVLTGVVIALFLALARLSAGQLRSDGTAGRGRMGAEPAGLDPGVGDGPVDLAVPDSGQPELESLSTGALLANVALSQGVFGVVLVGGAVVFSIPATAFGAGDLAGDLVGLPALFGLALGVALWLGNEASTAVVDAAGIDYDERLRAMLAPDSLVGWLLLLVVVLPVIAGVEELVFRAAAIGVVSTGLTISPWALAVVSSLLFGLGHGAQGTAGVVVTGTLGFVLAAGFVLTGSVVTVVVAHYVINALEFLVHEALR